MYAWGMANERAIIMDNGEPYVHMQTLMAHIREHGERAAQNPLHAGLVPGMASVLDFLAREHDSAVLFDRKD